MKPRRMCVCCREMKDKPDMTRIVLNKEDTVSIDETGKKHGRGAYICFNCAENAAKSKGLERSFKKKIPEEIYEWITNQAKTNIIRPKQQG
jgi:hypothetical protein